MSLASSAPIWQRAPAPSALWFTQLRAIIRIEMRKTFFAKRGLWIYLLALAPVALFLAHSLIEIHRNGERQQMAIKSVRTLTDQDLSSIRTGMSRGQVIDRLGDPAASSQRMRKVRTGPHAFDLVSRETLKYSNENTALVIGIEKGKVVDVTQSTADSLGETSHVFAGVFQFFFLRLAIFFGCLGIFMSLFRGEMLDKSLHFYLLAPIRREVLVIGKYLAGLLAATVIFSVSTALQLAAMLLEFDSASISHYLFQNHGSSEIVAYLGVTVLACIGYGSVFLAAGLLFRNPILPAAAALIWEASNPILPALLKKVSIIYYLKSLCPVNVPLDPGMPPLLALLASNPEPISGYVAVSGLLALSVLVLAVSARGARTLEINYTTD